MTQFIKHLHWKFGEMASREQRVNIKLILIIQIVIGYHLNSTDLLIQNCYI